jgi:quinol-cytochrome oxidoreductase complex cytochrome b subunit
MPGKRRHFINHLHPQRVSRRTLSPLTTMGFGIAALTCLGVLIVTGITLFLYYNPDEEQAYERILHITTTLRFGRLVRDLHSAAANALLILTVLHLIRVFLTAGYKGRKLCWIYGLGLFALILAANFTGYVLPWDQVSYWAVKVGATLMAYFPFLGEEVTRFILSGSDIGADTLPRVFAIHTGILPPLFLTLTALHLWRLRKSGGLAAPPEAQRDTLPVDPWLYRAEGSVALLTFALLVLAASFLHSSIFERPNPQHPPNPVKAPWYFVGIQEMVSHSAFWGGVIAPSCIALFLVLVPFLDSSRSSGGIWLAEDRWIVNSLFILLLLGQIGCIVVGQWLRGANWAFLGLY